MQADCNCMPIANSPIVHYYKIRLNMLKNIKALPNSLTENTVVTDRKDIFAILHDKYV